jgi:hypothetical protein
MRCRDATEANEYVIPSDSWSGYFKGVKREAARSWAQARLYERIALDKSGERREAAALKKFFS